MATKKVPIGSSCGKSPNGMHKWKNWPHPDTGKIVTWCEHCNNMPK